MDDKEPGQPNNSRLQVTDEPAFTALSAHMWEPYLHLGDGYKVIGYRRADGMGYVLPVVENDTLTDRWWASWAHPMMCGHPGWHHHAFGSYGDERAAAFAFDEVYALELCAGNTDRCPELKRVPA